MRPPMPRTKIVCTIGPASRSPATLERLVEAGMSVARLNFSHGTHEEHAEVIRGIREIAVRLQRPVAILQDLAGVKLRIGGIAAGSAHLDPGGLFVLTTRDVPGDAGEVSIGDPDLPRSVRPGDRVLLADGQLELSVLETTETDIRCRVVTGGTLSSRKGIHLPSRSVPGTGLTPKDHEDLAFGAEHGIDYAALSFVRSEADVLEARRFLEERGHRIPLIAKIEKHEALVNVDRIVAAADGILVARGDLGIETPLEHVPILQKMLIARSNLAGKPVVTATQMLQSMVENPRPTRAEVTDVANAILDGTDAVMLSEETATGRYPVEAVETMSRIAADAETAFPFETWRQSRPLPAVKSVTEAIADAACLLAEDLEASAIIACTQSGVTAQRIAQHRPRQPILAMTPLPETFRRLSLIWGVVPILIDSVGSTDEMMSRVPKLAAGSGTVRSGDRVVITAGIPMGVAGSSNSIKAAVIP